MGFIFIPALCAAMTIAEPPVHHKHHHHVAFTTDSLALRLQPHPAQPAGAWDDEVAEIPAETATTPPFGEQMSSRWSVRGGYGYDLRHSGNHLGQLGVGASYFIVDDLSLDAEINTMYFNQTGDDAWGVNMNLLFRWHFLATDTYSLFVDAGAGVLGTSDPAPEDGSRFNFVPQAGGGFTIALGNDVRLVSGVRWHHISNSNLFRDNPGRDSLFVYTGLNFPF